MAGTFTREVGIAFGAQTVEGTADATIAGLSGSLTLSDGIVLGDANSGIVSSGISHSFTRRLNEKPPLSGSFTKQSSDFLEEQIALSFALPLSGPRNDTTATPVDGDFVGRVGVEALYRCAGLFGAASGTPGHQYIPIDVDLITAKLFDSGNYWVIKDIRGDVSINLTPGEIAVATYTLSGIVDSFGAVAFPTFDYEELGTVSAPVVASVSPVWGFDPEERGWTSLTIGVSNSIESIPDSASDTGSSFEQTNREITVSMTIKDTDTDIDFTRTNLVGTTAPTDDLTATIGDAATGSDPALAVLIEARNLEVRSYTPDVAGTQAASTITAVCTATIVATEFKLENV